MSLLNRPQSPDHSVHETHAPASITPQNDDSSTTDIHVDAIPQLTQPAIAENTTAPNDGTLHNDGTPSTQPTCNPGLLPPHTPIVGRPTKMANPYDIDLHKHISHIVDGEIDSHIFESLDGLIERMLPTGTIGFDPSEVMKRLYTEGGNGMYDADTKSWKGWPEGRQPSGCQEKELADFMNKIGQAAAPLVNEEVRKKVKTPRTWSSKFCNSPVPHGSCQRKPDIVLMNKPEAESTSIERWGDIFAAVEVKSSSESAKTLAQQLGQSARLMFGCQPDRRFVLAVAISGKSMNLAVFNRAGMFMSTFFDVHKKPELLVRIAVGLLFADRATLGLDPSMIWTRLDGDEDRIVEVNEKSYEILKVIHVECVIRGRATVVLKVQNEEGKILVVKNGWVDDTRLQKETMVLEDLNKRKVKNVPKMEEYEYVKAVKNVKDRTDSILTELHEAGKISDALYQEYKKRVEVRDQLRIVLSPFGVPLTKFRSLRELISAVIDVVDVIEEIHKAGYLHRDISLRNIILVEEDGSGPERRGFLIDYDYCINFLQDRQAAMGSRTGTFPFMAVDIMKDTEPEHKVYHELESLLYILIYISFTMAGPEKLRKDTKTFKFVTSAVGQWFGDGVNMETAGKNKSADMETERSFQQAIISGMDSNFEDFEPCFKYLRSLIKERAPVTFVDHVTKKLRTTVRERNIDEFIEIYRTCLRDTLNVLPETPPKTSAPSPGVDDDIDVFSKARGACDATFCDHPIVEEKPEPFHIPTTSATAAEPEQTPPQARPSRGTKRGSAAVTADTEQPDMPLRKRRTNQTTIGQHTRDQTRNGEQPDVDVAKTLTNDVQEQNPSENLPKPTPSRTRKARKPSMKRF